MFSALSITPDTSCNLDGLEPLNSTERNIRKEGGEWILQFEAYVPVAIL